MKVQKTLKSFQKLFNSDEYDSICKQEIEEKSIPGTSAKIYIAEGPLFILLKHHSVLIPTIYALSIYPNIIPRISLKSKSFSNDNINNEIKNLSLTPGCIFIIYTKNQFNCISKVIKNNNQATFEVVYQIDDPIHTYLVRNFNLSFETQVNALEDLHSPEPEVVEDLNPVEEPLGTSFNQSIHDLDENPHANQSPDEVLYRVGLMVLKHHVKKDMLPLEPSQFLNLIKKNRGTYTISIQTTSYKKITKFIEYLDSQQILKFAIHPNFKREMILDVYYDNIRVPKNDFSSSSSCSDEEIKKVNPVADNIEILYSIPIELCEMMYKLNLPYDYESLYTKPDIRKMLTQYIKVFTDSDKKSEVLVDSVLSRAFSLPQAKINKSQLFELLDLMVHTKYLITFPENPLKYSIQSQITFINITQVSAKVNKFKGNKHHVSIQGFEFYKIDAKDLCNKLQALGKSVFKNESDFIKFQGKVSSSLIRIFTNDYSVPTDFIKIHKSP
jgi:translation initiation factor 1 (eIF-1/SUI1)